MKRQTGIWLLRLCLVVGGVIAGCVGKEDVAGYCIIGLFMSFIFISDEE